MTQKVLFHRNGCVPKNCLFPVRLVTGNPSFYLKRFSWGTGPGESG